MSSFLRRYGPLLAWLGPHVRCGFDGRADNRRRTLRTTSGASHRRRLTSRPWTGARSRTTAPDMSRADPDVSARAIVCPQAPQRRPSSGRVFRIGETREHEAYRRSVRRAATRPSNGGARGAPTKGIVDELHRLDSPGSKKLFPVAAGAVGLVGRRSSEQRRRPRLDRMLRGVVRDRAPVQGREGNRQPWISTLVVLAVRRRLSARPSNPQRTYEPSYASAVAVIDRRVSRRCATNAAACYRHRPVADRPPRIARRPAHRSSPRSYRRRRARMLSARSYRRPSH